MLTTQDYSDILTAAIEGGITYWANDRAEDGSVQVERIMRATDGDPLDIVFDKLAVEDVSGGSVALSTGAIIYPDGGGQRPLVLVGFDAIKQAIEKLAAGEVKVRKDIRAVAARLHCGDSDAVGDADAEVADVIVQVALFGEVVYG
jgi:hypothetical protein